MENSYQTSIKWIFLTIIVISILGFIQYNINLNKEELGLVNELNFTNHLLKFENDNLKLTNEIYKKEFQLNNEVCNNKLMELYAQYLEQGYLRGSDLKLHSTEQVIKG